MLEIVVEFDDDGERMVAMHTITGDFSVDAAFLAAKLLYGKTWLRITVKCVNEKNPKHTELQP